MADRLPLKWPRPRFRVSVRGLIVLVLIVASGLGWIVQGVQTQREAVAAIRRDGGSVGYDWDLKESSTQGEKKPEAPKWLVDCLGVDYFGSPVSVSLHLPRSTSIFREIGRLGHIETLDLRGPLVTDEALSHLKGLTHLSELRIGDREVGDRSGTLRSLGTARVTDAGLSHLKGLTNLSYLDLNGTQVGDVGLASLAGLMKLETLRLTETRVTDVGLAHLEGLTGLTGLELGGTAVTDVGMARLADLRKLKFLDLRGTQITDAGLDHLGGLKELRMLDLSGTRITDAGLAHLKGLTGVWDLDLRGTRVSAAGARALAMVLGISSLRVGDQVDPPIGRPGPGSM